MHRGTRKSEHGPNDGAYQISDIGRRPRIEFPVSRFADQPQKNFGIDLAIPEQSVICSERLDQALP